MGPAGRLAGTAAVDHVTGRGEDPLQVSGTAFRADKRHLFLFVHHQHFHVFVTVQAFEFEYGHCGLLVENFLKIVHHLLIVKRRVFSIGRHHFPGVFHCGPGDFFPTQHAGNLFDPFLTTHGADGGGGSTVLNLFFYIIMVTPEAGNLGKVGDAYQLVFF
jgi:hypothetical protein